MAQQTGFTPGPWRVEEARHSGGFVRQIVAGRSRFPVARVLGDPRSAAETQANAHLIATAPELYAELVSRGGADSVLAKARGEQA